MLDGLATSVGDKGVVVCILAKSSNRSDIFTLLLVGSLHTSAISSNVGVVGSGEVEQNGEYVARWLEILSGLHHTS